AGLDHADGKAMERDVEDVPTLALEPRRLAAEVVVVLQQQDCVAAGCQPVGGGQAGKPRADDDHVILGLDVSEPVLRHYSALSLARGTHCSAQCNGSWRGLG